MPPSKNPYAKAEYDKEHYAKLIAAGLCVKCKKPRDGASRWRCKACLRKMREHARAKSRVWATGGQQRGERVLD